MADDPQHVVGEWRQWLVAMSNPSEDFFALLSTTRRIQYFVIKVSMGLPGRHDSSNAQRVPMGDQRSGFPGHKSPIAVHGRSLGFTARVWGDRVMFSWLPYLTK